MIFALLIFLAALALEGIGTWVSVIGLSAIFASSPVVVVLAICLDFAKIMTVSFTYKYWASINKLMKIYMTIATLVLVTITSTGAFGFLSGEFQKAIADTGTQSIKITTLEEEKGRLQKRKEEIDAQITNIPANNVKGRTQLIKQFGPEVNRVNDRLVQIDKELPDLKIKNIDKELHVGPIMYVAKAFNTTPEEAVKWVILTIIFVFDPLAISLLIAGNFLLEMGKKKKEEVKPVVEELNNDVPEIPEPSDPIQVPLTNEELQEIDEVLEEPTPPLELVTIEPREEEPIQPSQPVELELVHDEREEEERTDEPQQPLTLKRHIKVEERNGRDVISLETEIPKSSLESVSSKIADISPEDASHSLQTMKLQKYYTGDAPPNQ